MNYYRLRQKCAEVRTHRKLQYEKALDLVIEGKAPPEYAKERYEKYKRVKPKR